MLVVEKYRCTRQVGWSDAAEVHAGPLDPTHHVPVAVKIRHGLGGPPRPGGNRDRFLRAANDQQAAVLAGCKFIAPIFETGGEEDNAFYVTRHFQRSIDSLIQGRVAVDAAGLHRLTAGVLAALEELRDRHNRPHGNLKPTNIFLDGKDAGLCQCDPGRPRHARGSQLSGGGLLRLRRDHRPVDPWPDGQEFRLANHSHGRLGQARPTGPRVARVHERAHVAGPREEPRRLGRGAQGV